MKILSIESSCDETSIAVIEDGKKVLSNVTYTQIDIHKMYGGVVPEVASRHHIEKITYVLDSALKDTNLTMNDIDRIAVTSTPGLVGSLMVGINCAKTFLSLAKSLLLFCGVAISTTKSLSENSGSILFFRRMSASS